MDKVDPQITLVVCTRNRASKLPAFFEAINRLQCDRPWDLVLVDSGSTDETNTRLQQFAASYSGQVKVVAEPQAGLGRARNRGWRATAAPIIAFTDDDCYPEPKFLNDVLAVFTDPAVGFCGGRILLHDPTDAPITIYERATELVYPAKGFIGCGGIQGANMAFRRQALIAIDGFDDHLGAGTRFAFEDADAEIRALSAGWVGKYDPRSVVYHHHGRKPGPDIAQLNQSYHSARGAFHMKCLLHMPQRWFCLRFWLRSMPAQPFDQTVREIYSALRYFFYQLKQKPNVSY
jgi:glycosyltransferase involved in cell wall biosynthesis